MVTSFHTDKLVVISDLHFGNPFSREPQLALEFMKWAAAQGFDICINGDGIEVAQTSPQKILSLLPDLIRAVSEVKRCGRTIYYVLGNHDVGLEHFLADWGHLKVSPHLEVTSGEAKIRIEHGHIYDPLYTFNPRFYEYMTHVFGMFLRISPHFYKGWIWFERMRTKYRAKKTGIVGEPPQFKEAAREIANRGFNFVIFGHTHQPGDEELENQKRYLNPGSWLFSCHYIEINKGQVELKQWDSKASGTAPALA
jgi:UDP-2,3-diacylglucosamine pyrophosphatase LpxH